MSALARTIRRASGLHIPDPGGGLVLSESFNTADAIGNINADLSWITAYEGLSNDSSWDIISNKAVLVEANGPEDGWALVDDNRLAQDVHVESLGVTVRMAGGNARAGAGLVARATTGAFARPNGYFVVVGGDAIDIGNRLVALVRGDGTILDSIEPGFGNTVYTFDISLTCVGTTITGTVTDPSGPTDYVVSATDSTHTGVYAGLFGHVGTSTVSNDYPKFDNFEVGDL